MSETDNSTKVSLGCGSLILIAIIVLIFSRSGDTRKLENELRDARSEITELKAEIAKQSLTLFAHRRVHPETRIQIGSYKKELRVPRVGRILIL